MKLKIRTKIFISAFCVILAAIGISGVIIYDYAINIQKEQSIGASKIKLEQVSSQLRDVSERGKNIIRNIITDEEVMSVLSNYPSKTEDEQFYQRYNITQYLAKYVALNEPICNIILKDTKTLFGSSTGYESYYSEILENSWYLDFKNKGIKQGYTKPHDTYFSSNNKQETVMSYIMEFTNIFSEDKEKGVVVLDIKYKAIKGVFDEATADFERMFLLDTDGEILYATQSEVSVIDSNALEHAKNMSGGYKEEGDNIIIVNTSVDKQLKQVAIISKRQLFKKTNVIFVFTLATIIGSFLFLALAMTPIILSITKPITRLTSVMERVSEGDLEQQVNITTGDELELLGRGFNKMIIDLKTYINDSVENEQKKRKMQIMLLMAQINPHFLYNTLNNINYLIVAKRNEDATIMTECLIGLLNDTVKIDCEYATVAEELRIIEKYIQIQHYRYRDKFVYRSEISPGLERAKIPRTIIQPIVENALFHGIAPLEDAGEINIQIYQEFADLYIRISDTGVGMCKETIDTLFIKKEAKKKSNQTRSIGLQNINERLRDSYNDLYDIKINSEINAGTSVILKIPLELVEENEYCYTK